MTRHRDAGLAHPTAVRVLTVLAELATDGGLQPGGPLHDVYHLSSADAGPEGAPLDAAVLDWIRLGCPIVVAPGAARTRARILDALAALPRAAQLGVPELAQQLGLSERLVRWHVARLVTEQRVRALGPATAPYSRLTLRRRATPARRSTAA